MRVYQVRVNVEVQADSERDAVLGFLYFMEKTDEVDIEVRDNLSLAHIGTWSGSLDSIETGEIEKVS